MSIKPMLNNPDAFDKWMENEEIEFKEPPIQEAVKKGSTSQSIAKTTTDPTQNNPSIKPTMSEVNENPNIRDAIAIDIGTSKCKIAICKEKYIQIVEHEANRSVPSYVALSEQGEWLIGRMAENYAVCLQNVIYDVDSLYRTDDNQDHDLVEVIQKDEIKGYYNEEVDKIIKKVGEACKDLKPKFILLAGGSTRIPLISEGLAGVFKDSTICNFLNVDEVAAIGAAAIISKTVTVAEKSIGYERVIEIIKEEELRNPPPTPTPDTDTDADTTPVQDANADTAPVQDVDVDADGELSAQDAAVPAPANDTPIPRIPNKIHFGDDKLPEDPHASQDNRSEHPNISYSQPKQPQSQMKKIPQTIKMNNSLL
ncbi:hypothetical protein WR25_12970 [Diploscapter pachys]|uniref:Uncharacterized protein n=1 Tax=Diploscapter pachys TaxID=2018661 RepID=A0A2A2K331_9BILA|nr:hypothetical protein WR25_12970 [Diploscapter pachys]